MIQSVAESFVHDIHSGDIVGKRTNIIKYDEVNSLRSHIVLHCRFLTGITQDILIHDYSGGRSSNSGGNDGCAVVVTNLIFRSIIHQEVWVVGMVYLILSPFQVADTFGMTHI